MKLIICSPEVPFPPDSGLKVRVFNLARELSRRHEVLLFCLAREPVAPERLQRLEQAGMRVEVVVKPPMPATAKSLTYLRRLASGVPPRFILSWEEPIFSSLKRLAAENGFDVALADHLFMMRYARSLNCPKLFTAHNVEGALAEQMAGSAPVPARWWRRAAAAWISAYERRLLRSADAVVAVSGPDMKKIAPWLPPGSRAAVVENGVDCVGFQPLFEAEPTPAGPLLFLGLMDYAPNADAAKWFVRDIFPLIRDKLPRAGIRIAGGGPAPDVTALDDGAGIRVTGYVENVSPLYEESSVMVVPLRQGGGSRLKILEAFAAGLPVVSTSKGAEGIEVEDGVNILLADDPERFAAAVLRLLDDPELYQSLRKSARRLVERRYDWPVLAAKLETMIDAVAP